MPLLPTRALAAAAAVALAASAATPFCGQCANGGAPPMSNNMLTLACTDAGATIAAISFASYGTPTGTCGGFAPGACNAANSTSVVSAACVGRGSCAVFPNTTTFGDPCFGTPKVLDVQAVCTSGPGTATCSVPAPPPPANVTTSVTVVWGTTRATLRAEPSIQVVSQAHLWRDSPVHDASFASLAALAAAPARAQSIYPTTTCSSSCQSAMAALVRSTRLACDCLCRICLQLLPAHPGHQFWPRL